MSINLQHLVFEYGKKSFIMCYQPGTYDNTNWAVWNDGSFIPLHQPIKEVFRKAESNGWVVFNYTDLPDKDIWYTALEIAWDYHTSNLSRIQLADKYGLAMEDVEDILRRDAEGTLK